MITKDQPQPTKPTTVTLLAFTLHLLHHLLRLTPLLRSWQCWFLSPTARPRRHVRVAMRWDGNGVDEVAANVRGVPPRAMLHGRVMDLTDQLLCKTAWQNSRDKLKVVRAAPISRATCCSQCGKRTHYSECRAPTTTYCPRRCITPSVVAGTSETTTTIAQRCRMRSSRSPRRRRRGLMRWSGGCAMCGAVDA